LKRGLERGEGIAVRTLAGPELPNAGSAPRRWPMGKSKKRRKVRRSVDPGNAKVTLQEAMAALDLLERYFNQPPVPCCQAVDAVLGLRRMACAASATSSGPRGRRSPPPPLA
jgi:hypothetical protein